MNYSYYEVTLGRERTAQLALRDHLQRASGDRLVAMFSPLLGFASDQALVLLAGDEPSETVTGAPGVVAVQRHALSPTLRPKDGARPSAEGIYVHNWFTVDAVGFDEFVKLSGEAWPDFEARFETTIFGLFAAAPTPDDHMLRQRRLLLMTRYRDLGEWQVSRDPTTAAMKIFARRRELTRTSLARACLLMPQA